MILNTYTPFNHLGELKYNGIINSEPHGVGEVPSTYLTVVVPFRRLERSGGEVRESNF